MHQPVMLNEVVEWLRPRSGEVYIDGTVGEGGHSRAILEAAQPRGFIIGFDCDEDALTCARENLESFGDRVRLVHQRYQEARATVRDMGFMNVEGIVLDLGVSSRHLDTPARGFSFQSEGPLDMRMDLNKQGNAADLINRLPETELARIIYEYGEERYARRIARAIVRRRERGPILTTQDMVAVIRGAVPPAYLHGRLHFATRTFQALRIAVNEELTELESALRTLTDVLRPGGRLVVLSFHSLEDRIVKHTFRGMSQGPEATCEVLTKRPIRPSAEEARANPRARSAKLRVLERKAAA